MEISKQHCPENKALEEGLEKDESMANQESNGGY